MIELVFVACMMQSPDACQERSMVYVDVAPMTCVMGAQPELAKWVQTHPHWQVIQWKCRAVDTRSART